MKAATAAPIAAIAHCDHDARSPSTARAMTTISTGDNQNTDQIVLLAMPTSSASTKLTGMTSISIERVS